MTIDYSAMMNVHSTPQSEPIPGEKQVKNNAGGFVYELDCWKQLERFLILGAEGNTYYCSEREMVQDNAKSVLRCLKEDGIKAIDFIVKVSVEARAPKNDPAIFCLALALKKGDEATRKYAADKVPEVCRIGTHVFHLAKYCKALGGMGRLTKRAIRNYYAEKCIKLTPQGATLDVSNLAYDMVKYQQRDGWSHADLIRQCHLSGQGQLQKLIKWCGAPYSPLKEELIGLPEIVEGFERIKKCLDPKECATLVSQYRLPRECVPTEALNHPQVWDALLPHMGITALVRNLGKMSAINFLKTFSNEAKLVCSKLVDEEQLKKSKVHPIQLLSAMRVYAQGHGERGKLSWTPVDSIVSALESAFYMSFKNVEPTGKNVCIALDISGSMSSGNIAGIPGLTPREASSAMALVTGRTEVNKICVGFATNLVKIPMTGKEELRAFCAFTEKIPMGGTDCSLPMRAALQEKWPIDTFIVYTDNETWAGGEHPVQSLRKFRQGMGRDAKLIVVGMTSTGFTIADPSDAGMMDVVGFDASAPAVMSDFMRG